jgi:hypothetical protein
VIRQIVEVLRGGFVRVEQGSKFPTQCGIIAGYLSHELGTPCMRHRERLLEQIDHVR